MASDDLPELRTSDAEREQLVAVLREHAAEGRLSTDELEERSSAAYAAATRAELAVLRRDLPTAPPSGAAPAPAVAVPDRFSAVLGSSERSGRWLLGERLAVRVILGEGKLDLRHAEIPAEVRIEARVRLGELTILVPEGARVEMTGRTILGDRKVRGRPGAAADGPVIRIDASVVLGELKVDVETLGERVRGYLRPGS